jgi:tetratricopeptide (TPR) repeat protein
MKLKRVAAVLMTAFGLSNISNISNSASKEPVVFDRLREIHQRLMDPEQVFSISATLATLDALEAQVPEGDLPARGELNFLRGFVFGRNKESTEAVHFTREALRIDAATPFLTEDDRSNALYRLAINAEDAKEWDVAIDAYKRVIPLFAQDPSLNDSQRLGTLERLGFCLHEAEKYAEAMTVNREVIAKGEQLFGTESPKLLKVLTNLAQNAYELKDYATAQSFLERRLKIAKQYEKAFDVDDSLFQLGVLAFEQGRQKEAEDFMKRRLEIARKSGDHERIENAEDGLRMLYEKLKSE